MADYPTQGLILQNLEQQKDGKNEKDLYNHNAASINTGDYFWGGMRATTFCIGPDAFSGQAN
jgi:hypothetical protein